MTSKGKSSGRSGKRKRVEAAGGVVLTPGPERLVAVVHRPRYDDWSLPKGKLDEGEGFEQAALREVEEETGLRCKLGAELESNSYRDHKDRQKLVRWFLMEPLDDGTGGEHRFEPNDEVDELRWLSLRRAAELVDYQHDRLLLTALEEAG
jgi:8-oxo-dGTP diphosphatase